MNKDYDKGVYTDKYHKGERVSIFPGSLAKKLHTAGS